MDVVYLPAVRRHNREPSRDPSRDPSREPSREGLPRRQGVCRHEGFVVGAIEASICPEDSSITWSEDGSELDPMEALARLFGNFDLAARLDALWAPGGEVFAYTPESPRGRARLRSLPAGRWIEVSPDLWAMSDGSVLLLSPTDPLLLDNFGR